MQVDLAHRIPEFIRNAELAKAEDLFALSPSNEREVNKLFDKVKSSLELLANTPIKSLQKILASSGKNPFEQVQSISSIWNKFSLMFDAYAGMRTTLLNNSLLHTLLFSYLRSLQIDFHLALKSGSYNQPLPFDRLQTLPGWPDYVSCFYVQKLNATGLQKLFLLSRKLQEHLQDPERVKMVILEFFHLLSYKVSLSEMHSLLSHRNVEENKSIEVTSPTKATPLGEGLELALLRQVVSSLGQQEKTLAAHREEIDRLCFDRFAEPENEFDAGYYLMKYLQVFEKAGTVVSTISLASKVDHLLTSSAKTAANKLRGLQAQLRRKYGIGMDQDFNIDLAALADDFDLFARVREESGDITESTQLFEKTLSPFLDQIKEGEATFLSTSRLQIIVEKISATLQQEPEGFRAKKEFFEPLFATALTGLLLQSASQLEEIQDEFREKRTSLYRQHAFQWMVQTRSTLSSFLPPLPTEAVDTPTSSRNEGKPKRNRAKKSAGRRKQGRRHKTQKSRETKKPPPRPKPSPIFEEEEVVPPSLPATPPPPEEVAPIASREATEIANLAQLPLRLKRHPRTHNRPEFVDDSRNQALHYLPPQLVQMLLQNSNPFIAKYVQWEETDPNFAGNHSVRATVLCHDRKARQVYVGELSIGMTFDGLIYHVYLNPFANPLGGKQPLEQSVDHHPPVDLQDAKEGFSPAGKCQISYNEELEAIDALDIEKNRLYRVFKGDR